MIPFWRRLKLRNSWNILIQLNIYFAIVKTENLIWGVDLSACIRGASQQIIKDGGKKVY
jgi:hypothetical protein